MKKIIWFLFFCLIISFNSQCQTPTWSDNIACIFYSHCTTCHNSNGIAPFSLISYVDVFNKISKIQSNVQSKKMPPWPSDEKYQQHGFSRTLTQEEINAINDWINAGAPSGNLANAPPPPTYSSNSQLPDKNISFTTPVQYVSSNYDDWWCFAFKTNIDTDTYIKAWEIVASNPKIVHHVEFYTDSAALSFSADTSNSFPGYQCDIGLPFGSSDRTIKGTWFPGSSAYLFPIGLSTILPKNSTVTIAVHFSPDKQGDSGWVQLNMIIDSSFNRSIDNYFMLGLMDIINGPLFIPADSIKTFYAKSVYPLSNDITCISVLPHMHLLGKSFKTFAVTPLNDTIRLADIPDWDFHWQTNYFFQKAVKIPSGSWLEAEVIYDNTSANPDNPNSPPIDVQWGFGSKDEMLAVYMGQLDYMPGDEDIVNDTSGHLNHYLNCSPNGVSETVKKSNEFIVYPTPTQNQLTIFSSKEKYTVEIFNQISFLAREKINHSNYVLNLEKYPSGIYFLTFYDEKHFVIGRKKIALIK